MGERAAGVLGGINHAAKHGHWLSRAGVRHHGTARESLAAPKFASSREDHPGPRHGVAAARPQHRRPQVVRDAASVQAEAIMIIGMHHLTNAVVATGHKW